MNKEKKALILVGAPPGCGKTYIARRIADKLAPCVFLDLDMLNPLSAQICEAAGVPYDKGGEFFKAHGREYEYRVLLDIAFANLEYTQYVIAAAPFTKELRDGARLAALRLRARELGAGVHPVWVTSDSDSCHENMLHRAASRDSFKLAAFDDYIASIDFAPPEDVFGLTVIDNRAGARAGLDRAISDFISQL